MIIQTSWHAGRDFPAPDRRKLKKLVETVVSLACPGLQRVAVTFLSPDGIARVNEQFLGHHGSTDVICFDYRACGMPQDELINGGEEEMEDDSPEVELFICPAVAAREAAKRNLSYSGELTLYLVHGFLHAGGYDDLKPELKRKMRVAERRVCAALPVGMNTLFALSIF